MRLLILTISLMVYSSGSFSKVRNIKLDDERMLNIKLRIGRSTLIRLPSTIEKVIIGNSNYYQFEFEGNEITLKPKDLVSSNLFLKTKRKSYGFIINVVKSGNYDDLLKIVDKVKKERVYYKKINRNIKIGKQLQVEIGQLLRIENSPLICIEGWVKTNQDIFLLDEISIQATRGKWIIAFQEIIFEKSKIKKGHFSRFRLYIKKELISKTFRLNFSHQKDKNSLLIKRKDIRKLL